MTRYMKLKSTNSRYFKQVTHTLSSLSVILLLISLVIPCIRMLMIHVTVRISSTLLSGYRRARWKSTLLGYLIAVLVLRVQIMLCRRTPHTLLSVSTGNTLLSRQRWPRQATRLTRWSCLTHGWRTLKTLSGHRWPRQILPIRRRRSRRRKGSRQRRTRHTLLLVARWRWWPQSCSLWKTWAPEGMLAGRHRRWLSRMRCSSCICLIHKWRCVSILTGYLIVVLLGVWRRRGLWCAPGHVRRRVRTKSRHCSGVGVLHGTLSAAGKSSVVRWKTRCLRCGGWSLWHWLLW